MKNDLEDRLIAYSVMILEIVDNMEDDKGANHLAGQLIRSGTAPSLIYGEAQAAESRKDFIHKMRLSLKELRETYTCLKIIHKMNYAISVKQKLMVSLEESNELISIFVKSVETARKKLNSI